MPYPRAMTPAMEARALAMAEAGQCRHDIAAALGLAESTVARWERRAGVTLTDGRTAANRARVAADPEAWAALSAVGREAARLVNKGRAMPLKPQERKRYKAYRDKLHRCGVRHTRADALRAIGRADLVRP